MAFIELKYLILAQIGIDIAIIIVFVFLIKRLRFFNIESTLIKKLKIYESLLSDADKISGQFKEQLEKKDYLIKKLNEQLNKKILSLNVLLNRAEVLLCDHRQTGGGNEDPVSLNNLEKEIIKLAKEGHDLEEIAETLSVPKEKAMLILDLKKKISQSSHKEGAS